MAQQRDAIKVISPPWLSAGTAERYMYSLGLASDATIEKLNQAVHAWMPGQGTDTALPYIGLDRVMPQGPFEAVSDYARRLQKSLGTWQRAGRRLAVMSQALTYLGDYVTAPTGAAQVPRAVTVSCSSGGEYATWDTYYNTSDVTKAPAHVRIAPSNWGFDADDYSKWWRTWLTIFLPATSQVQPGPAWGTAGVKWGDSSICWGFSISSLLFTGFRALVALWKSANTWYPWFIFSFNVNDSSTGSECSPNSAIGSGNADTSWQRFGKNVAGVRVPSRPTDTRFVWGTGIYDSDCTIPLWT